MKQSILIITAAAACLPMLSTAQEGERKEQKRRDIPEAILKKFDEDGDGKLNREERAALRAAREERKKELLEQYDTDKDGKISKDEREAAMKEWREKVLQEFDADGDGKLNDEEAKTARTTLRERGEHPPFAHYRRHRDGNNDKPKRDKPETNL